MCAYKFQDNFAWQGFTGCLWWTAGRQVALRCSRAPGKSVLGSVVQAPLVWSFTSMFHTHPGDANIQSLPSTENHFFPLPATASQGKSPVPP